MMLQEKTEAKRKLEELIGCSDSIAIIGHIRPDGDDIGSCLSLYNYIRLYRNPSKLKVFLEEGSDRYDYLAAADEISHKLMYEDTAFDLVITSDVSSYERLGDFGVLLKTAKASFCIDHHISNSGICEYNYIVGASSSSCEVVYELIKHEYINKAVAECLYTGIVTDTGVFKYSCTSPRTMEIAGDLLKYGLNSEQIIDRSFYSKSYRSLKAWGYAFEQAVLTDEGACIYSVFTWKDMKRFNISSIELDGISSELKNVESVRFAMLLYQNGEDEYKASLRSVDDIDVSKVCEAFGGGGHKHAAGCTITGDPYEIAESILTEVRKQF